MSSESVTRTVILLFTLLSLAVAGLNSAQANFAILLRDRARSDYANTDDVILNREFQSLQTDTLSAMVITAIATSVFAICGFVVAVLPKWLREHKSVLGVYAGMQIFFAFFMIATGGFVADHVRGFQTSFKKFGGNDITPYYGIMFYGGIAQAAYGSALVFLGMMVVVLVAAFHHHERKPTRFNTGTGGIPIA